MTLQEQIQEALTSAFEKLGIRPGQTPPAEETPDAARLAALEAEKTELLKRAERAEAEALAAKSSTEEAQKAARMERCERVIEALKSSFRITPAVGDKLAALAKDNPDAFEAALPCFEALEPHPSLSSGKNGQQLRQELESGGNPDADGDALHNLTLARIKEMKETYAVAFAAVSRENPELARSVAAPRTTGVVNDAEG